MNLELDREIEKIVRENGKNLNFNFIFNFEIKIRNGNAISILLEKEIKNLKIVYNVSPDSKREGRFDGYGS